MRALERCISLVHGRWAWMTGLCGTRASLAQDAPMDGWRSIQSTGRGRLLPGPCTIASAKRASASLPRTAHPCQRGIFYLPSFQERALRPLGTHRRSYRVPPAVGRNAPKLRETDHPSLCWSTPASRDPNSAGIAGAAIPCIIEGTTGAAAYTTDGS